MENDVDVDRESKIIDKESTEKDKENDELLEVEEFNISLNKFNINTILTENKSLLIYGIQEKGKTYLNRDILYKLKEQNGDDIYVTIIYANEYTKYEYKNIVKNIDIYDFDSTDETYLENILKRLHSSSTKKEIIIFENIYFASEEEAKVIVSLINRLKKHEVYVIIEVIFSQYISLFTNTIDFFFLARNEIKNNIKRLYSDIIQNKVIHRDIVYKMMETVEIDEFLVIDMKKQREIISVIEEMNTDIIDNEVNTYIFNEIFSWYKAPYYYKLVDYYNTIAIQNNDHTNVLNVYKTDAFINMCYNKTIYNDGELLTIAIELYNTHNK
jgi:hypothetical protein